MEFPHLGKHCSEKSCNKLDFLPMSCDACLLIFCSDHFNYQKHNCTSAHKKDVQVPACPLCGACVPTPRGISADLTVSQHIDQFCKSDKTKIFTNRCSFKGCKKKELIPISCQGCRLNFCLRHRHTTDHNCSPRTAKSTLLANAAINRQSNNQSSSSNHLHSVQGEMTEDEALAHALARSIQELDESHDRNRRNQQQVPCNGNNSNSNKDKCVLS